jgi:hypothetical protein
MVLMVGSGGAGGCQVAALGAARPSRTLRVGTETLRSTGGVTVPLLPAVPSGAAEAEVPCALSMGPPA